MILRICNIQDSEFDEFEQHVLLYMFTECIDLHRITDLWIQECKELHILTRDHRTRMEQCFEISHFMLQTGKNMKIH